jgi:hypothetical protein
LWLPRAVEMRRELRAEEEAERKLRLPEDNDAKR